MVTKRKIKKVNQNPFQRKAPFLSRTERFKVPGINKMSSNINDTENVSKGEEESTPPQTEKELKNLWNEKRVFVSHLPRFHRELFPENDKPFVPPDVIYSSLDTIQDNNAKIATGKKLSLATFQPKAPRFLASAAVHIYIITYSISLIY